MSVFIGLMSGTSADGMDAALVQFDDSGSMHLIDALCLPYSNALRHNLKYLATAEKVAIDSLMMCEKTVSLLAAEACNQLLQRNQINASSVQAIGCHGHTIRHKPQPDGYSWQINDPSLIAEKTGIPCIADFRRRDIAAGGEGAPLVPAFHQYCVNQHPSDCDVMLLNLGGIANLTVLGSSLLGFDTGPGNALMDDWCHRHWQQAYDDEGKLARQGRIQHDLLKQWMSHPYFQQRPPKSTGRELFSLELLLIPDHYSTLDILATLAEFTAMSVAQAIQQHGHPDGMLYVCGGGVDNNYLMQRLQVLLPNHSIASSQAMGIHPHWMEAMAFAWLAKQRVDNQFGNASSVTGAQGGRVLGGWYA
ncbi:MAG: anhydro-N-acetylmuramic acid kinase [Bacterioplanes sp.]|nr:anhydro-N-acetylmuramic acid kinase [Bacterioplanes sp.]